MIANFLTITENQAEFLKTHSEQIEGFLYSDHVQDGADLINIDKAWHGLHYLLTGSVWEGDEPLCSVVLGGDEVGDDLVYGPVRFLAVEKVKEISAVLKEVCVDSLMQRYDAQAMNDAEVYPPNWTDDDNEWLMEVFEKILDFYNNAASEEQCVVLYLT